MTRYALLLALALTVTGMGPCNGMIVDLESIIFAEDPVPEPEFELQTEAGSETGTVWRCEDGTVIGRADRLDYTGECHGSTATVSQLLYYTLDARDDGQAGGLTLYAPDDVGHVWVCRHLGLTTPIGGDANADPVIEPTLVFCQANDAWARLTVS